MIGTPLPSFPAYRRIQRGKTLIITHKSGSAACHFTPAPPDLDQQLPAIIAGLEADIEYRCAIAPSRQEKDANRAGYIKQYFKDHPEKSKWKGK